MVTSRDVAKLARVSQPTVSRALRDDPLVSAATRERVRQAAEALGYAPNPIGRALSTGRSTRVGLVLTDLDNQFYPYVIAPMHDELVRLGYELVLITESSEAAPVAEHVVANGLCGVILATTTLDSVLPVRLRDRGIPLVYFNRVAKSIPADAVTVDPQAGAEGLVKAIASYGHSRVGAIFGPPETSTGERREAVIRDCLLEAGVPLLRRNVRHGPFDFATGARYARELLEQGVPPTLLICANDVVAFGALNAAAELGVRVPADVSIVGFDDLPPARWALVQLSTIRYDLEAMARQAVQLLISRVDPASAQPHRIVDFPTSFVQRATLGPAT